MSMHLVYWFTIPLLWAVFGVIFFISRNDQKENLRHESLASWLCHNLPILFTFLLISPPRLPLGFLGRRFVPWHPVNFWIGAALVAAGLGLALYARRSLKGNWSITIEIKKAHELVCSGPYRWVRHPIYTGLLLAFAGSALTIGQWRGIVGFLIVYLTLRVKARAEERYMTEAFGDRYRLYKRQVPALVPFLRGRT